MPTPVNFTRRLRVDGLLAGLVQRALPTRCLLCETPGTGGSDLCADCGAALPWNRSACARCALPLPASADACGSCLRHPPPLQAMRAAFVYGFPVDRLLPRLKFHRGLAPGRLLARLMADEWRGCKPAGVLVPVPLHMARLRERGYDQALELARPLATSLGMPLCGDLLARRKATSPQSRLDAAARHRNLRDAFVVRERRPLPEHVTLFDDVMTTGATLHAAARALRRAGVVRVDAWVCARVP